MAHDFARGFVTLDQEITRDQLPVQGRVPAWLAGSLLRNGPAQYEVGQRPLRHWFDGLAMLHRFTFTQGQVSCTSIELPRINYERNNGRDYQFAYGVGFHEQHTDSLNRLYSEDFMDQLVKIDVRTGTAHTWYEEGCYPGEPVFVAAPGATGEDEGVVLSVVLDGQRGRSFLLVLDAASFTEMARAEVPHTISFGFHGIHTW